METAPATAALAPLGEDAALLLCSVRRLEEVHGGQAGFAVDELEGDFGAGSEVERVESFGVGGVDDAVEAYPRRGAAVRREASRATPCVAPPWRMMLRVR